MRVMLLGSAQLAEQLRQSGGFAKPEHDLAPALTPARPALQAKREPAARGAL